MTPRRSEPRLRIRPSIAITESALTIRQFGPFFDAVDRVLGGVTKYREYRGVRQMGKAIIPPLSHRDHPAIHRQNHRKLGSVETDASRGLRKNGYPGVESNRHAARMAKSAVILQAEVCSQSLCAEGVQANFTW